MRPWQKEPAGTFVRELVTSRALEGNPLGDPHERPLWVYLPPGYDDDADRRYPSIYVIQGLTGQVDMWWNRSPFRPNFPELADRMFAAGEAPGCVLVMVDAFTSLGGSQFVNSPGTGRYLDYLCDELVGIVDQRYRTIADRDHRGITGKSSGGYGAMVVPMLRPDVFGALASHAGDALFETCYLPEFRVTARTLRDRYEGSYERFWTDFRSRPAFSQEHDGELLNCWCMAACYSAEQDGTVTLPFDPATGRLREEVWQRWLEMDPVRMAPKHAEALRSMRGVFLDAGKRDEYYLDLGMAAFAAELDALGIAYTMELFEGTHMGIEYRYPKAVAFLAERLHPGTAS
ncbi:MAG TPA: alpha/beta hydrolase-fold protein [Actinomycetota bacterium]|nr:alpha/beta hydrolase-fold protein [Actinomycetota bacterium]